MQCGCTVAETQTLWERFRGCLQVPQDARDPHNWLRDGQGSRNEELAAEEELRPLLENFFPKLTGD